MNNKEKMLNLMKVDDPIKAVEDVLESGLLPKPQLQQWLNRMVERAIRRSLGKSGCPEWETWAAKWLSGEDRTAWAAAAAAAAAWAVEAAAATAAAAAAAAAAAWAEEAAAAAWAAAAAAAWAVEAAAAAWAAAAAAVEAAAAAWAAAAAAAVEAASWAAWKDDERKAQYDDLLNLIKQLDDKF